MNFLRSRRRLVAAGIFLLLLLFLARPGANRLHTRIVNSISRALGRPVEVSSVHLRLLPRPGFDLEDFVVQDNPAFGAEPMLRSAEVTASLRVTSLLRGRLEIARLSLTEPSLNLARNGDGHWNLENLLERAEKMPVAPTAKSKTERRPGFPYIEADRARINFKTGFEKTAYALTEADFSLWQESEDAWGMRLRATPVRTDFNLSDTGLIRVNGTWHRAASLHDTPLAFTLAWDNAQLGQLTKLIYGNDKGWRGALKVSADLSGTPAALTVHLNAGANDFRRYDILAGGAMRLAAQCAAEYSSTANRLSAIDCRAPVGDGTISVAGSIASPITSPDYDLRVTALGVPMQSLLMLVRHVKQGIPENVLATGQLDARMKFSTTTVAGVRRVVGEGGGQTSEFRLVSNLTNSPLLLNTVPFTVVTGADAKSARTRTLSPTKLVAAPPEPHIEIGPLHVALGKPAPVLVQGWISHAGYDFGVQGEALLARLLEVGRWVGLPALQTTAEGSAKVELQITGNWSGFAAPKVVGSAALHSIQAPIRGWNAPLQITAANLTLAPDHTSVQNLTASAAGTAWTGSLTIPRPCPGIGACPVAFNLHADEIAVERLNLLLNPNAGTRPWYQFLSSSPGTGSLALLNATGKLAANRVVIGKLVGDHLTADVELKKGRLALSNLRADVLSGHHSGEWKADFTAAPPQFSGTGNFESVALGQLARAMNDAWISGTATASYRMVTSGLTSAELFSSAVGSLQVEAVDGVLPRIALVEGTPLQMRHLTARLSLHGGKFEVEDGKLTAASGLYQISGTVSPGRVLNLKLTREGAGGFNITGTLMEPHSTPTAPETRVALKKP